MGRYRGPRLRIIRRLGCPIPGLMQTSETLKRPYAPGYFNRKKRKKKDSEYALRLKEKQKLRYHYGLTEHQISRYVNRAFASRINPGLFLLIDLESRLDNVVFRSGFARSIAAARQMIRHGHFLVNNYRANFPSYKISVGDLIEIKTNSSIRVLVNSNIKGQTQIPCPQYLATNKELLKIQISSLPIREDIPVSCNEKLIIEYYSGK